MPDAKPQPTAEPQSSSPPAGDDSTYRLSRRLLTEYGIAERKRYAVSFLLMGIGAACAALSAYLMGTMINEAYDQRNFPNVVWVSLLALAVFILIL